ncbi:GlxA family transcriptional regulator [Mumia sp. DW29H23]|uniref:GlxA family transcriptional regulator n=1 Tax=Mumia sp. DW29H23 TaxID=3421241 RepID=UPI003D697FCB
MQAALEDVRSSRDLPASARHRRPRRTVVVVVDRATDLLGIASLARALQVANQLAPEARYEPLLASVGGAVLRTEAGVALLADVALDRLRRPVDTLVVACGAAAVTENPSTPVHVLRVGRDAARVTSLGAGAALLAAARRLDGAETLAHHRPPPPHARAREAIGAAVDLARRLVEDDLGADLARAVARSFALPPDGPVGLAAPGGSPQLAEAGPALARECVDHIRAELAGDLGTAALARRVNVSNRHLTRLFVSEFGTPPGRLVRRLRCEAAARLLATTRLTVETIARDTGFRSTDAFRQAFARHFGMPPSRYRALRGPRASDPRPANPDHSRSGPPLVARG